MAAADEELDDTDDDEDDGDEEDADDDVEGVEDEAPCGCVVVVDTESVEDDVELPRWLSATAITTTATASTSTATSATAS